MRRQNDFPMTLGRTVNWGGRIGGWNNGQRHYANRKFVLDWTRTLPKRTIDSGRFIVTRVNRKKLSRK